MPQPLDFPSPRLARSGVWLRRHSRALSAGFIAVLGGFAAAAFGVGSTLPDPADQPQRIVTDVVAPQGLSDQLDALADHDLELWRSELTRATDNADTLLRRLGIVDAEAAAFLRRDPLARRLLDGRGGKMVQARAGANGALIELVARYAAPDSAQRTPQFTRLSVSRVQGRWASRSELAPLLGQVRLASGTIRTSLFAATDEARIPDAVAVQMAEIFAADIDFHRELQKGDTFSVVYEALTADGEPVTWAPSSGRVLSAEFVNGGKSHQALWYTDASGRGAYFGFDGQSKRRSFLASPLEFSRITSGFAMRMHPILQTLRAHRGIDYGAPSGTPVRSVADGVVEFAGWQNGYGNVVKLLHSHVRTTLYAHLSRIDVRKGQAVDQGQYIGAVGATGWATGPHLHFEFQVNGEHVNPLNIAKGSEPVTVDAASRARFAALSRSARLQLDLAETLAGGRAQTE
ncbi:MAG TPA: M23 family metallopeptidase [Rubrivivax sp.]|nr:M23 family metallopeptidase [Rubrivivax sp.]